MGREILCHPPPPHILIKKMATVSHLDLFAGTGGFSLALKRAVGETGDSHSFSNDLCKGSEKVYTANFSDKGDKFVLGDLTELSSEGDIPAHNVLTGGFPCQPFSLAGKKLGFQDERSNVFFKIVEIIKTHNPEFVLLENVKNLITHDAGKTFKTIIELLEGCGYSVGHAVLNSLDFGLPQCRERVYIFCHKDPAVVAQISEAVRKHKESASTRHSINISDLLEPTSSVLDKYYYSPKHNKNVYDKLADFVAENPTTTDDPVSVFQYRRFYVRRNARGVCPTLTANMGTGGHNVPILGLPGGVFRKLTPRECFRLQGFPDSYILPEKMSDGALYKLAGNAISVPVAEFILRVYFEKMDYYK